MDDSYYIIENSSKWRGYIIHEVSWLERWLDVYISTYFCSDSKKGLEMADIVLGNSRISLDGKRKLFDILVKRQCPEFNKTYPKFNKDMNTVMYERNCFAHNIVSLDAEAVLKRKKYIGLRRFGTNTRVVWYTATRVNEILADIKRCQRIIEKACAAVVTNKNKC